MYTLYIVHFIVFFFSSINAETTKLGDHLWKDFVEISENQKIYGMTIVNSSSSVQKLTANFTEIEGLLNKYNLTELLEDTADFNTTEINAHKIFDRLEVLNLHITNGIDMDNVPQMLTDFQNLYRIEHNLVLPEGIQIENLSVESNLNGMKSEDFRRNWIKEDQIFYEEYIFDSVSVYGKTTILSNDINGISLKDIFENTIKANETFYFNDVTFSKYC